MAMAVRLSLTLFNFRSSSGCASVTFLRSARALFASAVIFSFLGHSLLGIVVILLVERRSPVGNPTLRSRSQSILMELTECQSPLESRRITQVNRPKSSECRNAASQTKRLFALIRNAIILPHAQPAGSFLRSDSHRATRDFRVRRGSLGRTCNSAGIKPKSDKLTNSG